MSAKYRDRRYGLRKISVTFPKNWGGPKGPPQVPKLVKEGDLACLPKHAYHIYRLFLKKTLELFSEVETKT
jgi:hypothetical protein